jgi:pyruvate dehydrogenase E2 component (dihydrolipoamide acetyltransferase)/2-oxoisovalerate dehydrogenase E2 component (dihydrolipoyl transacylase)
MEFRLPELGEGIYEAELIEWMVAPGDFVAHGQALAEVMTDKASMELPSPFTGIVDSLAAEPGTRIKVGEAILTYDVREESPGSEDAKSPALVETSESNNPPRHHREPMPKKKRGEIGVKAAPSVRRMAGALGIDLSSVSGSGPGGRVLIEDLAGRVGSEPDTSGKTNADPSSGLDFGERGRRIKMRGIRRMTAERMVKSKQSIPHYSYIDECDVSDLVRLRQSLREPFARRNANLTYLPFFVKAAASALREAPIVNASIDDHAAEIVLHEGCHIGVAASTPKGLMVPIVHDADKCGLLELAQRIQRLINEARSGSIRREDLVGGTFTVTSVGSIGGLISTPVINHPQAAILGVGKIVKRPVFDEAGGIRAADMVYLSCSFDHRIIDGAVGAAFCNAVIRRLQSPAEMLLEDDPPG